MKPTIIDAVRLPDGAGLLRLALQRRLIARKGGVSYSAVVDMPPRIMPSERRICARARSRLRSGKLLDGGLQFLADCLIHDRSATGARIRLLSAFDGRRDLHFFDEETEMLRRVRVVWRRGEDLGLHYSAQRPARDLTRAERLAFKGGFYAMRDA